MSPVLLVLFAFSEYIAGSGITVPKYILFYYYGLFKLSPWVLLLVILEIEYLSLDNTFFVCTMSQSITWDDNTDPLTNKYKIHRKFSL